MKEEGAEEASTNVPCFCKVGEFCKSCVAYRGNDRHRADTIIYGNLRIGYGLTKRYVLFLHEEERFFRR